MRCILIFGTLLYQLRSNIVSLWLAMSTKKWPGHVPIYNTRIDFFIIIWPKKYLKWYRIHFTPFRLFAFRLSAISAFRLSANYAFPRFCRCACSFSIWCHRCAVGMLVFGPRSRMQYGMQPIGIDKGYLSTSPLSLRTISIHSLKAHKGRKSQLITGIVQFTFIKNIQFLRPKNAKN